MWIFTRDGFYSVVVHRDDPECLLVRSRAEGDLVRLRDALGISEPVVRDLNADYTWRLGHDMEVTRQRFDAYLSSEVMSIDYDSHCKENMSSPGGTRDDRRYQWYLDVWGHGMDYQIEEAHDKTASK